MELSPPLLHLGAAQLALIGLAAFVASILGGLAGYGVGLVLPIFLAPAIGVAHVIPVMAVATALTNASRALVFRQAIDWSHSRRVLFAALPGTLAGAWLFTLLNTRWTALLLGVLLLASVPLRRARARKQHRLGPRGLTIASAGYGALAGGMTGTGAVLIGILTASGLQGAALIGTDAAISLATNIVKMAFFGSVARIDVEQAAIGVLAGLCTVPGAYTARWLLPRVPLAIHAATMDGVVLVGAIGFLWRALTP